MADKWHDRRLPAIQALRGVAASLVVFHHFSRVFKGGVPSHSWIYDSGLGNLGACGVDIFFVISGFIMVWTSREKAGPQDSGTFILRRALRIYPLYWIWTSVLLALWMSGFAQLAGRYSPSFIAASYLLIPCSNGVNFHPLIVQGWTLSFELLFYLIFSLAILLRLRAGKLLFCVAAFGMLASFAQVLNVNSAARYLFSNQIITEFLYGALAAELILKFPANQAKRLTQILPFCLIAFGGIALLCTMHTGLPDTWRAVFWGLPAFVIVYGAAMLGSGAAPRLLVYLGDCSYSIYITHEFLLLAYASYLKHHPLFGRIPADAVVIVGGTITVVLTSLGFVFLERPLTRWLAHLTMPKRIDGRRAIPGTPRHAALDKSGS